MNITEAIEALKKDGLTHSAANEAIEAIKEEIAGTSSVSLSQEIYFSPLRVILTSLASELLQSRRPAFSYAILRALLESIALGKTEIEDNFALKGLFVNESLGSKTVKEGLWKCMVALGACTKSYYD